MISATLLLSAAERATIVASHGLIWPTDGCASIAFAATASVRLTSPGLRPFLADDKKVSPLPSSDALQPEGDTSSWGKMVAEECYRRIPHCSRSGRLREPAGGPPISSHQALRKIPGDERAALWAAAGPEKVSAATNKRGRQRREQSTPSPASDGPEEG
jgi:hypothetical protein